MANSTPDKESERVPEKAPEKRQLHPGQDPDDPAWMWPPIPLPKDYFQPKQAEPKPSPFPKDSPWYNFKPITSGYSIRQMKARDLFKFGDCNVDPLTETYQSDFYLDYLDRWPECCFVVVTKADRVAAYLLGKIESSPFPPSHDPYDPDTNTNPNYLPWHAHITALTVASWARGVGLGTKLSEALEIVAEAQNCWFVDLFVRADNEIAIKLYKKLGYTVYKRVVDYYADGEDAFDMRKLMPRDKDKKHIREKGEDFHVDPMNVW